ncbi:MAG: MBL fold metallo-hydrolase [Chryseolinea sp.]
MAGIILTHGHPDHVAGTYNIARSNEVPIYALASVKKLMEDTERSKHEQWAGMFGEEWVPEWVHPNVIVVDQEVVSVGGLTFTVLDLGSGGDCEANSIWLLEGENPVAFLGDFIYHNNHTYMADGSILRWLANLERHSAQLKGYRTYYIGHGKECEFAALQTQKEYFQIYTSEILKATNGSGIFNEESKERFQANMIAHFPSYGCQFMVSLSAEKVASELV